VDAHRAHRRGDRVLRLRSQPPDRRRRRGYRAHVGDGHLTAIIGGIIVFHDPIGSGALGITARFVAFCLVIAGAALMPAPMRATPDAD
jgi:hypothetical protein